MLAYESVIGVLFKCIVNLLKTFDNYVVMAIFGPVNENAKRKKAGYKTVSYNTYKILLDERQNLENFSL